MKKLLTIVLTTTLISVPAVADTKSKKGGLKSIAKTLQSYDTNGDKKVTSGEYENATKQLNFGDLDLNNDGKLSLGELAVNTRTENRKAKNPDYKPDMTKVAKKAQRIDQKQASRAEKGKGIGKGKGTGKGKGKGKGAGKGKNGGGKGKGVGGNRGGKGLGGGNRGGSKGNRGGNRGGGNNGGGNNGGNQGGNQR